jgi:hypothetical protein
MNENVIAACTSYTTCAILSTIHEINWTTVGAVVLLVARLCKDVPDAYDSIVTRIRKYKKDKRK